MGVNLLPQASEHDYKKADNSLRSLVMIVVWLGILAMIFVMLFFNQAVQSGKLKEAEARRTNLLTKIGNLGSFHDEYYSLAYKTVILSRIKTEQYIPSVIGDYVKEKVASKATVQQYYFDANGEIRLSIEAPTFNSALLIWHDLLKDKTVMQELNLTSFGQDSEGKVAFQLKGVLNLNELYERNVDGATN